MNYNAIKDLKILSKANNYNRWILELLLPFVNQRIIDIGSGVGTFTDYFKDRNLVNIFEISENCIQYLKKKYENQKNIEIHKVDVGQHLPATTKDFFKFKKFDTIIGLSVLEHIPNDDLALKNCYDLLDDPGRIILQVPAFPCLYGTLDIHYQHYRRYTKDQILRKMKGAGFKQVHCRYFNFIGFFSWFFVNRILKLKRLNTPMVMFYDKIIVKVLSFLEWCFPPPIGQCFLIVAEKK